MEDASQGSPGNAGSEPRATIVVVPRERFSAAQEALESVFAHTSEPFELVYVDGRSPRRLRGWLERQAAERGFQLLRHDRYLAPNEARNIGMRAATGTEYVAFLDNDVRVRAGWLTQLIECADETGAAVVGPLTCEQDFDTIHFAGGEVGIEEERDDESVMRHVRERMRFPQRKVASVHDELRREQCELCEFHCVMVRRSVLEAIGPFDEGLMSTREHLDFALEVARAGGSVWFEPESVVLYLPPSRLRPGDFHYYMLRWSDDWQRRSLERFRDKWELTDHEFFQARLKRLGLRRRITILRPVVQRLTLGRGSRVLERGLAELERPLNRYLTARHARGRQRAARELASPS